MVVMAESSVTATSNNSSDATRKKFTIELLFMFAAYSSKTFSDALA
jgi:hypothetical protein